MATTRGVHRAHTLEKSELATVLEQMRKSYGVNSVIKGSEQRQPYRIPTGIFPLDFATLGGIPHNRITMIDGAKHSGKTTLAERIIVGAQKSLPDQQAAHVDVEGTRDATWGAKIGVDNDALIYAQPSTGEQAVDMAEALVRTKDISLVVMDSIAALVPMKEIEDSVEDAQVALQAKLVTRCIRKLTAALIDERKREHFVTVLFINQYRSKIGGWSPNGDPVQGSGGKALGYATSLEITCKNKEIIKKGEGTTDYNEHAFDIKKNKMNAGLRSGDFIMLRRDHDVYPLGEGAIDDAKTMLAFAKQFGWYTGGGKSWTLEFPGEYGVTTFENTEQAILTLYQDTDFYWALRTALVVKNAQNQKMPDDFIAYLNGANV